MNDLTPEQINELKEKHGDELHIIESPKHGVFIVVTEPKRRHVDRLSGVSSKKIAQASRDLINDVTVYPEDRELSHMLEAKPALVQTFSNQILDLAGLDEEATTKKL